MRRVVSSDPELIERTLTGHDLELYRDHAGTAAARHLVLIKDDEWCYVIFRKDRRKKLRLFASVLYVSNPTLFYEMGRQFARHLLIHHGAVATLAEDRIVGTPAATLAPTPVAAPQDVPQPPSGAGSDR